MRIALFTTCVGDTLFPGVGGRDGRAARAPRARGRRSRSSTDLLRPDALQHRLRSARRSALVRRFVRRFADARSSGRRAVGVLRRRWCATHYPALAALAGDAALAAEVARARGADLRAVRAARRPPRRRRRRRLLPAPRHLPPDAATRLRLLRARRCAAAAAARSPRHRPRRAAPRPSSAAASAARSRSRTPTPRPRCSPTRCARSSTAAPRSATAVDSSCLMHIGGGLSRQRTGVRTMHLAEILARTVRRA